MGLCLFLVKLRKVLSRSRLNRAILPNELAGSEYFCDSNAEPSRDKVGMLGAGSQNKEETEALTPTPWSFRV